MRTLQWEAPLRLPHGLCMHTQVSLAERQVLITGGYSGHLPRGLKANLNSYLLDLQSGQIHTLDALAEPLQYPTGHLLPDGRAMVVGGRRALIFDPQRRAWVGAIQLRQSRKGHGSVLLDDGRVVVAGGMNRNSIEVIDPSAPEGGISRMLRAKLPWSLDDLKLTQLTDGQILILGGQSCLNGNTTDQSWVLDIRDPKISRIKEGPRLGIAGGVADHCVETVGPWVVVAGGEAQQAGRDIELASARLLNKSTLAVWSLPLLNQPHDDAVAVSTEHGMIVFGGYLTKSVSFPQLPGTDRSGAGGVKLPEISVPFAGAAVERLTLPQQVGIGAQQDRGNDERQAESGSTAEPVAVHAGQ